MLPFHSPLGAPIVSFQAVGLETAPKPHLPIKCQPEVRQLVSSANQGSQDQAFSPSGVSLPDSPTYLPRTLLRSGLEVGNIVEVTAQMSKLLLAKKDEGPLFSLIHM